MRWTDLVRGESHIDCASLSDPVLVREDGSYLYTLPSVVDDIDLGVTHVIRGEDHVTNTAVQIQIFEALGGPTPAFGHHNLLTDASGEGLSKRTGALSICEPARSGARGAARSPRSPCWSARPRRCGRSPRSTDSPLASISAAFARRRRASTRPSLRRCPRAPCTRRLSRKSRIGSRRSGSRATRRKPFWLAVRGNLAMLADAEDWWRCRPRPGRAARRGRRVPGRAAAELPPTSRGIRPSGAAWTAAVKRATGRKGRELFHPLRLALTGARIRGRSSPRCCR